MSAYGELHAHHKRLHDLRHIEAMAGWDEAAMMPVGGGEARADALATLRVILHEMATLPRLGDLFEKAKTEQSRSELSPWQAANLREMARAWVRATCLPPDLVEASSKAESRCEQAWRKLRPANDWRAFAPLLGEVIARKRETAAALSTQLGLGRYDALLDGYEPGARTSRIDPLFAGLRTFLPGFIAKVIEKQRTEPTIIPEGPFPIDRQRWLGLEVMAKIGFDFAHGRLDTSHHPFCGGVPRDVRITTRYDENDFIKSFMGVLHETGHAKYEQNLPADWLDQPVGSARSMSVHESQSLLQEMQVSRGRDFLSFATPLIAAAFPDAARKQPAAFTANNLYRVYTRVRPGFIRVDADEATYPCHVILRYEIERNLIEGGMEVNQIPDAWNAAMKNLLGLSTANNFKDGCMQDVHWPAGLIGYFPTYTLGALTAAQIFAAARRALPTLDADTARGDFATLNAWLRDHVWSRGSLLQVDELLKEATGQPIDPGAFKQHLENRYLGSDLIRR